jgi:two-component system cell cycle sensor histidine kinase/response regulator CckA
MKENMRPRKVVLVADDNATSCDLIRIVLQQEDYEVLVAGDGIGALQVSRTHQGTIDLLLTDVEMPGMDGISAYVQIKAERAGIKVLFVSGAAKSLLLLAGLAFLPKPFVNLDALRTKVRELLTERDRPAARIPK